MIHGGSDDLLFVLTRYWQGYFLSGIAVQFVFQLAVYLDLPVPAKYLAAELFER